MKTAKPKIDFALVPQTLVYDLNTENDPLVRQGIHGLYRLLYHGVKDNQSLDPNYGNSFPCLPSQFEPDSPRGVTVVKGKGWTARLTDSTLALEGAPQDLYPLFFGQVGTMTYNGKTGIFRPPGYKWENTAVLEKGHFCNMGGGPFLPTSTNVALRLVKGGIEQQDFLLSLNDLPRKESSQVPKTSPSWPLCLPPSKKLDADLAEAVQKFSQNAQKCLQGWESNVKANSGVYPTLGAWNNENAHIPFRDAFIMLFARLSFVWTTAWVKEGNKKNSAKPVTASVGLAIVPDSFVSANTYHRSYQGKQHDGLRPVLNVHGTPEFASWVLATAIGYPTSGRNVLHKVGDPEFHIMGHNDPSEIDPWGVHFRGAIREGFVTYDDSREFRGLRLADKAVHPQVLTNLSNGWTWCRGLDESLFQAGKDFDGQAAKVLNKLVEAMVFEPKDKLIVDQTRKFRGALWNHFKDKGYRKEGKEDKALEKAKEVMILRGLRNVKTASELLDVISRWGEMVGWSPYTDDVLADIWSRAQQDTLGIRALLSVSVHSYAHKKSTDGDLEGENSAEGSAE